MAIHLYEKFSYAKLLRFALPSVIMMIFTSVYGVVDGIFISNFCQDANAFPSVNLIMPFLMVLGAIGFMLGTGGSAIVAKTFGEGNPKRARGVFTFLVLVTIVSGALLAILGFIFLEDVAVLLGADEKMAPICVEYGRIILIALPAFMLQYLFQSFFVVAEKPQLGLAITVLSGCTNMLLDFLFVYVFKMEVAGAALATATSQAVGGILPLIYFTLPNKSILRFSKPVFSGKTLLHTCTNGSSELMTNVSMSVVNMLYNGILMDRIGPDGVSAYGSIMYTSFIFVAMFIGFSIGTAPITSYHYGAKNYSELSSLRKKSLIIITSASVAIFAVSEALAYPLAVLFGGRTPELLALTYNAFAIYSVSYLISGYNIYASSYFTALGNGGVSAFISFMRTLLLQVVCVLLLPLILGDNGIWLSITVAETLALAISVFLLIVKRPEKSKNQPLPRGI